MSYRNSYLVCYDVHCPRRLRRVRRFLEGYRVGGQKSFFECWLTPPELSEVRATLAELIDPESDRVHIFRLDPRMAVRCIGKAVTRILDEPFLVI